MTLNSIFQKHQKRFHGVIPLCYTIEYSYSCSLNLVNKLENGEKVYYIHNKIVAPYQMNLHEEIWNERNLSYQTYRPL